MFNQASVKHSPKLPSISSLMDPFVELVDQNGNDDDTCHSAKVGLSPPRRVLNFNNVNGFDFVPYVKKLKTMCEELEEDNGHLQHRVFLLEQFVGEFEVLRERVVVLEKVLEGINKN